LNKCERIFRSSQRIAMQRHAEVWRVVG